MKYLEVEVKNAPLHNYLKKLEKIIIPDLLYGVLYLNVKLSAPAPVETDVFPSKGFVNMSVASSHSPFKKEGIGYDRLSALKDRDVLGFSIVYRHENLNEDMEGKDLESIMSDLDTIKSFSETLNV